jgi:hypothetical protein
MDAAKQEQVGMATISCDIPGRLRVRGSQLRWPERADELIDAVARIEGVEQATHSAHARSLLVCYDPTPGRREQILEAIEATVSIDDDPARAATTAQATSARPPHKCRSRKIVRAAMLLSLAAGVGVVMVSKRAHVVLGVAFLGLATLHYLQNRRSTTD